MKIEEICPACTEFRLHTEEEWRNFHYEEQPDEEESPK